MVRRIPKTLRYEPTTDGLKALTALLALRDKAIKPLLAAAVQSRPSRGPRNPTAIDRYYETIRTGMQGLFCELGLAV